MRFFYAKKEQTCRHCKGIINYGDEAVIIRWKHINVFIPLVFHTACYPEWVTASFSIRYNDWKLGAEPRKVRRKRGRKFLYSSREQAKTANQLRSLRAYHRRVGHTEAVEEITEKLRGLELDANIRV